ncbi:uncharacterized protein si:dkey-225f5.4 isoform X2 [Betta splendens]|uniref:Uncharacterized protein si:dkey-225f5.4 isoform X2 n=1 Tax=Betta splendens TaxID=158456 RepID=A0A6P7N9N5_BETSP|nr:uncharacterized protein si:dkey-225f5.4 isoform X2 [Betta splendens]
MAEVRVVLQRCDPSLLDPCGESYQLDCSEAARMVLYLMDSRRVKKVLWRQLRVLGSILSSLEGLEPARQLVTQPYLSQPEGGAHGRWKALKVCSRENVEETETLLRSLQEKVQQIHKRRQTLAELIQQLHNQKGQSEYLDESLQKAQNALQLCDCELIKLRVDSDTVISQLLGWHQLRDELQGYLSTTQDVMHINLLSFNQSELCVELRPRRSSSSELEPLKLSVSWSHDDRFTVQVNEGMAGVVEDCLSGRCSELSMALVEVMECYMGHTKLLCEIQFLRSRFPIDWRPAQRLLIYLKSASLVCHMEVEDGYPESGKVRLLSVRRDGQSLDTSGLKPHKSDLGLTDWLVFLSCSPLDD